MSALSASTARSDKQQQLDPETRDASASDRVQLNALLFFIAKSKFSWTNVVWPETV